MAAHFDALPLSMTKAGVNMTHPSRFRLSGILLSLSLVALVGAMTATSASGAPAPVEFKMVRSATTVAANCLRGAGANVSVTNVRGVQRMKIFAHGLPVETTFVVWINQRPNAPFGNSWYLGDVTTDDDGDVTETFIGRFNVETFTVAPGSDSAPVVHPDGLFPDASQNPAFAPVHMYHVGLWFDSPDDALAAHCPNAQTPFNGDHTAGVQALSTRNFPGLAGPLRQVPA